MRKIDAAPALLKSMLDRVEPPQEFFPRELEMLRDFYESWVAYHTIPKVRKDSQMTMADYLIHVHTCIQQEREKLAPRVLHA